MTKQEHYYRTIPKYGFLTLVYLIEEYVQEENYEECQIIFEAIKEFNNFYNLDLPTMFDNDAVTYMKKAMQEFNLTGEIAINNLPYYAEEVKKLVALTN